MTFRQSNCRTAIKSLLSSKELQGTGNNIGEIVWDCFYLLLRFSSLPSRPVKPTKSKYLTDNETLNNSFSTVADSATSEEPLAGERSFLDAGRLLKTAVGELQNQVKLMRRTTAAALHELQIWIECSPMRLDRWIAGIEVSIDELKMKAPDGSGGRNAVQCFHVLEKEVSIDYPELLHNILHRKEQQSRSTPIVKHSLLFYWYFIL